MKAMLAISIALNIIFIIMMASNRTPVLKEINRSRKLFGYILMFVISTFMFFYYERVDFKDWAEFNLFNFLIYVGGNIGEHITDKGIKIFRGKAEVTTNSSEIIVEDKPKNGKGDEVSDDIPLDK